MDKLEEKKEEEVIDGKSKDDEILEKLAQLEKKDEDAGTLAKIMSDPDARALLEAKQLGKKVKVVLDEEEEKPVAIVEDESVDLESMNNKDLINHILKKVSSSMDSVLTKRISPLSEQLKNISTYIGGVEEKGAKQQVEEARKKYPDFNDFIPEIKELNRQNAGLNVEELYLIAKRRKVGDSKVNPTSEKPTSTSVKAPAKVKRDKPLPPGNAGFDQLLMETLEEIEIPENSGESTID